MKKRMYRATDLKKVALAPLKEQVRGQRVVLGVDVAKTTMYGTLLNEAREVLGRWKWQQPGETRELVGLLRSLPALVEVVLEPTGSYGDALRWHLEQAGIAVYRASPKRCKDYCEVFDGVPSQHDPKSAIVLARLHLEDFTQRWVASSEDQRALETAVREVDIYDDQYHRNLNRVEGELARHWPELTQVLSLESATLLALLVEYGDRAEVAADPEGASRLMGRTGRNFLKSTKIEAVLAQASQSVGVPMTPAERHLMQTLAREALRNRQERQHAAKRLKTLAKRLPSVVALQPAWGETTAAVLVSEVGEPRSFETPSSYVKAFGLNLKVRSSGRYNGQLRITKRGSSVARRWLYMLALRKVQRDTVIRAWYQKKIARDGGIKMKALIAIMRKLAAAMWHVARGAEFDSTKLFDVRRLAVSEAGH